SQPPRHLGLASPTVGLRWARKPSPRVVRPRPRQTHAREPGFVEIYGLCGCSCGGVVGSWSRFVRWLVRRFVETFGLRAMGSCEGSSRPLACEPWDRAVARAKVCRDLWLASHGFVRWLMRRFVETSGLRAMGSCGSCRGSLRTLRTSDNAATMEQRRKSGGFCRR
ncbi:hypothetical protein CRG98_017351, partial [Punica granatum]